VRSLVLSLGLLTACGDENGAGAAVAPEPLLMLGDHAESTPGAIIHAIRLKPTRSFADMMDLGTAHAWDGAYFEAAEAYEVAARQAKDADSLAAALYAKSAAAGYAGHLDIALETANTLVVLKPDSDEAAWLRLGLAMHTGDPLSAMVARDHVMRLDPEASGHEVFEPTTTIVVATAVVAVVTILSATGTAWVALTPPRDRREVVVPMFRGLSSVGGTATSALVGGPLEALEHVAGGDGLGRSIVMGSL
jgi:tetratricopeptide (TPR) repeat protein